MVHALPDDGNRDELLDGELLVSPSASYLPQRAVLNLAVALRDYCEALRLDLLTAPAAVTFSQRRELQPDILVLPRNAGKRATRFEDVGRLVLAVEVLSPSTRRTDRLKKRPVYQQEGVPEYWIVDPDARTVERWRPGDHEPETLGATLVWRPLPPAEALTIEIVRYFEEVCDS